MGVIEENEDKIRNAAHRHQSGGRKKASMSHSILYASAPGIRYSSSNWWKICRYDEALFTSSAAAFVPFNVVEMQMMDQPFYYGINQVSKEPIWANRKKLMNGNGFFSLYLVVEKFYRAKMEAGSVF